MHTKTRIIARITLLIYTVTLLFSSFAHPVNAQERSVEETTSHTSRLSLPLVGNTTLIVTADHTANTETQHLLVSDHLSSTRLIIAQDGTITDTVSYYPYGTEYETVPDTSHYTKYTIPDTISDRYYTGQRKVSPDSPLYNYQARYYNPDYAHFIQPDPVEGGNRFAYVAGNPIMGSDPSGHRCEQAMEGEYGGCGGGNANESAPAIGLRMIGDGRLTNPHAIRATSTYAQTFYDPDSLTRCGSDCLKKLTMLTIGVTAAAIAIPAAVVAAPAIGTATGVSGLAAGTVGEGTGAVTAGMVGRYLAKEFVVGATTNMGMEVAFQKTSHQELDYSEIAMQGVVGGLSQAVSFGLMGPKSAIDNRASRAAYSVLAPSGRRAATQYAGNFGAQLGARMAANVPALIADTAIISSIHGMYYPDESMSGLAQDNMFNQGSIQSAIGIGNVVGAHPRIGIPELGNRFAIAAITALMGANYFLTASGVSAAGQGGGSGANGSYQPY